MLNWVLRLRIEEDMWIMLLNSGRADVQMGASGDMLEVKARLTGIPCPGHLEGSVMMRSTLGHLGIP